MEETVEATMSENAALTVSIVAGLGPQKRNGTLIEQPAGAMLTPLERLSGEQKCATIQMLGVEGIVVSADGHGKPQTRLSGLVRLLIAAVATGGEQVQSKVFIAKLMTNLQFRT